MKVFKEDKKVTEMNNNQEKNYVIEIFFLDETKKNVILTVF